jgi:hypothetical protein
VEVEPAWQIEQILDEVREPVVSALESRFARR